MQKKKKCKLELVQKVAQKKQMRGFSTHNTKVSSFKNKKKSDCVVVTCGTLLFCSYLHGNLSALRKWCSELFGTV